MSADFSEITNIDRFIHEPSRLAILAVLSACKSADFTYLLNTTGLTKGNLSAQIKKLKEADYITVEKSFKGSYPLTTCAVTKQGRKALEAYKKQYLQIAKML